MPTKRRGVKPDGIDRIVANHIDEASILTRWEEVDAGKRRWLVVIYRIEPTEGAPPAVGYLRGPMNGGHWGHDAEQGGVPLAGWRESGLFRGAPPRVLERIARHACELGLEISPAKPPKRGPKPDESSPDP